MLGFIGTLFTSLVGGGISGLLGVAVQRFADHQNKKLDLQASRDKMTHELALREMDAKIMAQEFAARTQVAQIEGESRRDVAESEAFAASYNEPQRYSEGVKPSKGQGWALVILDFIRGIVRPMLTVYLCGVTTLIYVQSQEILGETSLTSAQALELSQQIVGTILYLATTSLMWYFGTRNRRKPPKL